MTLIYSLDLSINNCIVCHQVKLLEEKYSNSNMTAGRLEKIVESKNNDVDKLRRDLVQMEMEYQQELKAQKKLCDLYRVNKNKNM